MLVYLDTDSKHVTATMTTVHASVSGLPTRIVNLEYKFYMDNFFSPDLFDNLYTNTIINCCGTYRPNKKLMPSNFGRNLRLKLGDIKSRVKGNLIAVAWKKSEA
jgi:hypothetical protein